MNELISYFSTIPSSHRSVILVGGITFFWLLENAFPLFNFRYKKWHHAGMVTHPKPEEHNQLKNLLKIPFQKPRSHENN